MISSFQTTLNNLQTSIINEHKEHVQTLEELLNLQDDYHQKLDTDVNSILDE